MSKVRFVPELSRKVAANRMGKNIRSRPPMQRQPTSDGDQHRPSAGPDIVHAHDGKAGDEQENAGEEG